MLADQPIWNEREIWEIREDTIYVRRADGDHNVVYVKTVWYRQLAAHLEPLPDSGFAMHNKRKMGNAGRPALQPIWSN